MSRDRFAFVHYAVSGWTAHVEARLTNRWSRPTLAGSIAAPFVISGIKSSDHRFEAYEHQRSGCGRRAFGALGVTEYLRDSGFRVFEAGDAQQAMIILAANSDIDVVFADIQMPGTMDGLELTHYVREHWPSIKLMLTSGRLKLSPQGMPQGCTFFHKPYRLDTVASSMRAGIEPVRIR